ncbi:MAG TPA: phospho-N-acetylmuramoyl-pentapeptide-transferase [Clostridia bacterium]|nr:phospho-N-acetylmuramoyl-pentapeptide-transferase [Clostridia bacterium]HHY05403.1 phospho-N-acetylmuramoyl-pentapeptide-transferase [Clostridia bacterium]
MPNVFIALFSAVIVCLLSGPFLIPFLRKLKFGQHVRTDGPRAHLQKAGTPTMGGLMFFLSLLVSLLLVGEYSLRLQILFLTTLGFGLIGFCDDFIKIIMKRPLGLKAGQKIIGQIIIASVFIYMALVHLERGTEILVPGTSVYLNLGWFYPCFALFVLVGTVNAVNLTDGLDGLAAGVTAFTALGYLLISKAWGLPEVSVFSAALLGSCLGFLFFNQHPARIFMGDTGSLALGGAVGALAILTKTEVLLLVLGGIYVVEALSVILQVLYFKITGGQRLFLMAPLHHHFELKGWSEQQVVFTFWAVAALLALGAVMLIL